MTVDDPVPPALDPGLPVTGFRRSGDPIAVTASDSAGVRSLRVLVDGVESVIKREVCDYRFAAPCQPQTLAHLRPSERR